MKILGISMLMRAVGKTREATLLQNAYTAFSVYNTPRYDRSILSAVDNAAALRVSGTLALHCVPLPQRQQPVPARWSQVLLCPFFSGFCFVLFFLCCFVLVTPCLADAQQSLPVRHNTTQTSLVVGTAPLALWLFSHGLELQRRKVFTGVV